MSESKFTPGPWRISGKKTVLGPYGHVAKTFWKNGENDAHLICAAPDLYEALTAALKHILSEAEARNYDPPASPELVADIEAALAKAEGRS